MQHCGRVRCDLGCQVPTSGSRSCRARARPLVRPSLTGERRTCFRDVSLNQTLSICSEISVMYETIKFPSSFLLFFPFPLTEPLSLVRIGSKKQAGSRKRLCSLRSVVRMAPQVRDGGRIAYMKHFLQLTPGNFSQTQPGYPHLGVPVFNLHWQSANCDQEASGWTGVAFHCCAGMCGWWR